MALRLVQFDETDLRHLALGDTPPQLRSRALAGSLPPAFVATRSLEQLKSGKSPLWCLGFYMVEDQGDRVVGSCGFKDAPVQGQVEIGYGVSAGARRQGYATGAVAELIAIARATGQVVAVRAQVSGENTASTRVVEKTGFQAQGSRLDHEGEMLVQWVCTVAG